MPFFFIGFVLAAYLGMNTMGIAILGGAIAIYFILTDFKKTKELNELKKQRVAVGGTDNSNLSDEMEDFLS